MEDTQMKVDTFTSKHLVDEIRTRNSIAGARPRHETETAVSQVFDAIKAMTDRGESVAIRGLGTFKTKTRPGGRVKSPGSGEMVTFGPSTSLGFKATKKG